MTRLVLVLSALLLSCALSLHAEESYFVNPGGSAYHREGCRLITSEAVTMSLEDAAKHGRHPCRTCRPPAAAGGGAAEGESEMANMPDCVVALAGRRYRVATQTLHGNPAGGEFGFDRERGIDWAAGLISEKGVLSIDPDTPAFEKGEVVEVLKVTTDEAPTPIIYLVSFKAHEFIRGRGIFEHKSPEPLVVMLQVATGGSCSAFEAAWKASFRPAR